MMTPRKRVLTVLDGGVPDRVPKMANFYPEHIPELDHRGAEGDHFGTEIRFVEFSAPTTQKNFLDYLSDLPDDVYVGSSTILRNYSDWGYFPHIEGHGRLSSATSSKALVASLVESPLPAFSTQQLGSLEQQVSEIHSRGLAAMGTPPHLGGELFETAWRLRGWMQFMVDLKINPEIAHTLLDQIMMMAVTTAMVLVRAGVDILGLDDDVGSPTHMLISPETWRVFLKPRLATIIDAARAINPQVKVFYHSDGYIEPIIPELIEIGVDVLHPVQPDVMDPVRLKRLFGDQLAFWGTVGTQVLWGEPNPTRIREEVRERIRTVGKNGGLIIGPAYDLEPAIPWVNIESFFNAIDEFGTYH
ncbi:MAG: uroporphyrinogen decarboxylase family protein [Chloroflexota bacterium]